jgi:hypothetical protein
MKRYSLFIDGALTKDMREYVGELGIGFQEAEMRIAGPDTEENPYIIKVHVAFVNEEQATLLKLRFSGIILSDIPIWDE